MGFIIIWDTCTLPEYYLDLHNSLTLPKGYFVRYDYSKRLFDHESQALFERLINKEINEIDVVIFYGETSDYSKGAGGKNSKEAVSKITPYRIGKIVKAFCLEDAHDRLNSKIVYDIKLLDYPNVKEFELLSWKFKAEARGKIPFTYWHTFIKSPEIFHALCKDAELKSKDHWRSIVRNLQKMQFKNDSFWNINVDQSLNDKSIKIIGKCNSTVRLELQDESDAYFEIEYISPEYDPSTGSGRRSIKVVKTDNIMSNREEIALRPYSKNDVHIRGRGETYVKGELASIEFITSSETESARFPIGPCISFSASIKKNNFKLIFGVISGIIALSGFAFASKIPIYVEDAEKIRQIDFSNVKLLVVSIAVSSFFFLYSGLRLRKEFRLK